MSHKAFKVVIVTEMLILKEVCELVEKLGAKGYTLVAAGGKGAHHFHDTASRASVIDAFSNVKIEAIVMDKDKATDIADKVVEEFFTDFPGITYVEDVEVNRPEKFR